MSKPRPVKPKNGQESVWDYPRPPKLESVSKQLKVIFDGKLIASTQRGYRILETSHPPTYYFPPDDVDFNFLKQSDRHSFCEWKGRANYYHVNSDGKNAEDSAWTYPDPPQKYREIKDYITFYPHLMDACYVDDEKVTPQPGGFYGGWITKDIAGPFKGIEGSWGW